jgi:Single-strand binding protein family
VSARAVISGALHRAPVAKTSRNGKPFATFVVRERNGDADRYWSAVAFDQATIDALLSMKAGEPIGVAGAIDAEIYTPEGREPRISWKITVDGVLSAQRKPKANGREIAGKSWAAPTAGGVDDDIPL